MGSRRFAAGMVAIVVAAGAAGCGSSSSDDDKTTAGTLTPAAFRSQANAICRATGARIRADRPPTRTSEFAAWGQRSAQIQDERITRLAALSPPAAQHAEFEQLIERLEVVRDQTSGLATTLAEGTRSEAIRAGRENVRAVSAASRSATALGIPTCSP
ncbi:hypothetical protein [Conexibacter arvalis]|uniref:Lipoprotein n=1 Tax=Conexibacter arvalis TaxID=912552 RepID=A0A840IBK4_9ACTN|nr:hypothetical protein [Conexibacter arvalis]MBB4661631.1 hypothetical protein [Conexibacter arvalis]